MVVTTGKMLFGLVAYSFTGLIFGTISSIALITLSVFVFSDAAARVFAMWCVPVYWNAVVLGFAAYGSGALPNASDSKRAEADGQVAAEVAMAKTAVASSFFAALLVGVSLMFFGYVMRGQHEVPFVFLGVTSSVGILALSLYVTLVQRHESLANLARD